MKKEIKQAVAGCIENFPEYTGPFDWFTCMGWKYKEFVFKFNVLNPNTDEYEKRTIDNKDKWVKAGEDLALLYYMDKVHFYGWNPMDECTYDADVVSAIAQMYWFGEVIYG